MTIEGANPNDYFTTWVLLLHALFLRALDFRPPSFIVIKGDSNEAKIRVAEYSTILFQQGQFLSRVRPTKFKANIIAKIERY